MPSEFIWITLFIAPDGEFIHVDKDNERQWAIGHATLREPARAFWQDEGDRELCIENKTYERHTLAIPCTEMEGQRIRTWPCGAWDNFLREVIMDLEQKGDAPWKR